MRRLTLTAVAVVVAAIFSYAQAGVVNTAKTAQSKNTTQPNQEQPGPFGFPGHKTLCEKLMATPEQDAAILRIYNDYKKKEQKLQQAAAQAAQKKNNDNAAASTMPDAATLKGNMITEIRAVMATDEQKKKFQEVIDDLGAKKKKKT